MLFTQLKVINIFWVIGNIIYSNFRKYDYCKWGIKITPLENEECVYNYVDIYIYILYIYICICFCDHYKY